MARKHKGKKKKPPRLVVLRRGSNSQNRENEPFQIEPMFAETGVGNVPGYVRMRSINELPLKGGGRYAEGNDD